MIYFETNDIGQLTFIHYMPFNEKYGMGKTEEELLKTGYLVESLPIYTGEIPEGKVPELRYDGTAFSWEMVDAPEPEPEPEPTTSYEELKADLEKLKSQQAATDSAVLGLMNMMLGV